jgi:dTDP-4-dehydrorhamnose 3,5-epimerase
MSERSSSSPAPEVTIRGVHVRRLVRHEDDRGAFTEIYREHWVSVPRPVQWNAVTSRAGTMRGVHVHLRHADYLVLLSGRMWLGLMDLRKTCRDEPSRRAIVEITAYQPMAIAIPEGVAHGFLFAEDSMHVYAVTEYFDHSDELGCRWDDPELALEWPTATVRVSARDAALPALAALRATLGGTPFFQAE